MNANPFLGIIALWLTALVVAIGLILQNRREQGINR